jgi:gamma-glutamylcyclotransferase (GGCT)/AIG2-like uncharacterized protein YtfP
MGRVHGCAGRIVAGALLLIMVGGGGYLWYTFVSSGGYSPPPGYTVIEQTEHEVFVYGTLRNRLLRRIVIGRWTDTRPVVLRGYRKSGLDIEADEGSRVPGELLEVSANELRRLDRYERAGIRYERSRLKLEDGTMAWVYRRID